MRRLIGAAFVAVLAFTCGAAAQAAELKVLGFLSARPMLSALAPDFERISGHKVVPSYDSVAAMRRRITDGEIADVVITARVGLDDLARQGKVAPSSIADVARITIRLFVRAGAPKPDIASIDALKRTLLEAPSLAYTDPTRGGLAGLAFANALVRLGIAEQLKPKTKLIPGLGHDVVKAVAAGQAALGAAPTNDVTPPPVGIDVVGPLPKELKSDVAIAAGVPATSTSPEAAKALIAFLMSSAAAPAIRAHGLDP